MKTGRSLLGGIVVGVASSISLACGSAEIPVVAEDFSREGLGIIKIVETEEGSIAVVGDGEPLAEGELLPLIAYQWEEDGVLSGWGAMFSPFHQTNPAILDLTDADLTGLAAGFQAQGIGPFEITGLLEVSGVSEFLIDEGHIVYPISPDGQRLSAAESGPFISVFFEESAEMTWDQVEVQVRTQAGIELPTALSDLALVVMEVPRETLEISVEARGDDEGWSCTLFPGFRGATKGLVTYRLETPTQD